MIKIAELVKIEETAISVPMCYKKKQKKLFQNLPRDPPRECRKAKIRTWIFELRIFKFDSLFRLQNCNLWNKNALIIYFYEKVHLLSFNMNRIWKIIKLKWISSRDVLRMLITYLQEAGKFKRGPFKNLQLNLF